MEKKDNVWYEVSHFQTKTGEKIVSLTPTDPRGVRTHFGNVNVMLRVNHPMAGEQMIQQEIEFEFEHKTLKGCMENFEEEANRGIQEWLASQEEIATRKMKEEIEKDLILTPSQMANKNGLKLI